MKSDELRQKFLDFFKKNGHNIVPSSSLLPTDASVLFTTAGMQQFKQYYLEEESPHGKNVASCQKCIRTSDIDEVGDESRLTFFEMLGNFSFGGYFKEEAIALAHKFIVDELKLKIDYVTVFEGSKEVPFDKESYDIWKKLGIKESKIKKCGTDNFWGPTGQEGPCGPTTEIYVNGIEIWNIVFNEFFCDKDKKLKQLKTPGVDTGMGLERLAMVVQKKETVFETDLFEPIMKLFPDFFSNKIKRIIADHAKASVFLISDGVVPSNKDKGYILRRLLRRMMVHTRGFGNDVFTPIVKSIEIYKDLYKFNKEKILSVVKDEINKFDKTLTIGLKEFEKKSTLITKDGAKKPILSGQVAFNLYQTFGFPIELIREIAKERGMVIHEEGFKIFSEVHKKKSQTASSGMFKGGLADHNPETIKLHTAHHLLLAALQEIFGKTVKQRGSNINSERLRLDFSFDRKLTDEEKIKIENIVNQKIKEGLLVVKREMPKEEAEKIGAEMEFGVKYNNTVSVYFIEDKKGNVFSKEFCGGPHVKKTSELGKFKIIKEEALGAGVRRIKAILEK